MSDWFSFQFQLASFILGFTSASVFWWLLKRLIKYTPIVVRWIKSQVDRWRQKNFGNLDLLLRLDAKKRAQHNHLSGQLFALDEILIKPRLLVPTENEVSGETLAARTLASTTIPYHPDWPEITSQYPYPSITLSQAIQKNANLAIIGPAGSGKTVALAHLVTLLAGEEGEAGERKACFPVYLHVNELSLSQGVEVDPLTDLITAMVNRSPVIIQKRIPAFLKGLDQQERLILILDGMDELHPKGQVSYVQFIKSLLSSHPKIQIIVAASSLYFDGLLKCGFTPLSLAAWSQSERIDFINLWQAQWSKQIQPQLQKLSPGESFDPAVLTNWIDPINLSLTPLEWTLRLWSIFAGDLAGGSNIHAIQAYIERASKGMVPLSQLQSLALGMVNAQKNAAAFSELETYLAQLQPAPTPEETPAGSKKSVKMSSTGKAVDGLLRSGLLVEFSSGVFAFSHPVVVGYLASFKSPEPTPPMNAKISSDPIWVIADLVEHYLAAQSRAVGLIENLLLYPDPPLFLNLFRICRWVKDVPTSLPWRTQVMRQLVQLIHREDLPLSLRSRFISAAACTNDPSIPVLFRQLLASPSTRVRQLAALGCGSLQDQKSIDGLTRLLVDPSPEVRHTAAFAIGIIKSATGLTVTEDLLKSGDENLSQVAAECLAAAPDGGHLVLRAATQSDQILVRRAAVIGLAQTRQDWAYAMIEKIAIQDGQWVVRNVAGQTIEALKHHARIIPSPLVPAHESPWLLAYASQSGGGIPAGDSGLEFLLSALQKGSVLQKIGALEYLRAVHTDEVLSAIAQAARENNLDIEQTALNTLWFYALSGAQITP